MSKPSSPFANVCGNDNPGFSFRGFGDDGINSFQQAASQDMKASPFGHVANREFAPFGNSLQSSRLHASGSSPSQTTCQTIEGVFGSSSTSSFSFGISSPFTYQHELRTPFKHSAPFDGPSLPSYASQSEAKSSFFGHQPSSSFPNGRASLFVSSKGKATPDSSSASSFLFGKAPLLATNSKEHEPRVLFQQSPSAFSPSFGNSFLSIKPETHNVFQTSMAHVGDGRSSLNQKEVGSANGSTPIGSTLRSPFGPGPSTESSFGRPSVLKEKPGLRVEDKTKESQGIFPSFTGQNVGAPVLASPFSVFAPSNGLFQCGHLTHC